MSGSEGSVCPARAVWNRDWRSLPKNVQFSEGRRQARLASSIARRTGAEQRLCATRPTVGPCGENWVPSRRGNALLLSLSPSLSRTFSDTAGWSKSRKLPVGESPRFACAKVAQGIEQVSRPTLFQVRPFSTRARRCHREGRTEATQSWRTFLHGQLLDISFC